MDNLTHTLFGLTLARTRLGRTGRGATAALVLASNAPDADIVSALGGTAGYLSWHRGPTHGLLGVMGLGLIVATVVWFTGRWTHGRRNPEAGVWRAPDHVEGRATADSPGDAGWAPFATLVLLSVVGVTGHILMDLPTSYGTRLLSPFSWRWFTTDWMPIVDIYLLIVLGAGLIFGRLSPDARRPNVAIVLVLMATIYGLRGAAHREAIALAPRVFGPTLPGPCPTSVPGSLVGAWPQQKTVVPPDGKRCLLEIAAMPTFLSPFRWRIIAHVSNAYEVHDLDLLDRRFREDASPTEAPWRLARHVANDWPPEVAAAASTDTAQTFLRFSRFPAVRTSRDENGVTLVVWRDLRFDVPLVPRQRPGPPVDPFSVTVRVGPAREILLEQFSP
jgi:membrane-bound metal-dependent hydrolase YbcI (DUF457 family)